jgi:hypothetical protein
MKCQDKFTNNGNVDFISFVVSAAPREVKAKGVEDSVDKWP